MCEVSIRKAALKDASPLAELAMQLGYSASAELTSDRLAPILASHEHAVFVAQLPDGLIVGWLHVFVAHRVESGPFAELGGFVVRDGHRGHGIGKRLLATGEDWVVAAGVKKLRVRTQTTRADAHVFYRRMGFEPSKEQKVFDKQLVGSA